ncbi:hypothetical protein MAPG_01850 [Magnaporthiopsis poae ATCC 64411]|uniref:Heterokaryon incompatibility domain-containing protein n=1 Tax=Magnaporthiopsis poae (strain ATCC 64411 / 73-15) TaxID=644358 RepID=A0A0C4DPS8_MAGP6|nr:hypothetical protein MAPG_01850 [Magnaporthiopsis poae ATCC 64411]
MSPYDGRLPEGSVRLLRLLPHQEENARIECQLIAFPLLDRGSSHPYEALSYVWGSEENKRPIYIGGKDELRVTANLHAALRHLRHSFVERILWVDAVCINQDDNGEKGQQVQFMSKIYAKASRVIVWLVDPPKANAPDKGDQAADGGQADSGGQALEALRAAAAAGKQRVRSPMDGRDQKAILALLGREWFQRIWVLQEVAAAKHILMKSSFTEIDGHAFCKGLSVLKPLRTRPDLQALIPPIVYLIKGAVFRRRHDRDDTSWPAKISLNIRPLGELVDMYHTRKATEPLDKVYALLGMSSDDPGIEANYESSWKDLFRDLVNFSLSNPVSVSTWDAKDVPMMEANGHVFADVSSARGDTTRDGREHVGIFGKTAPSHSDAEGEQSCHPAMQAAPRTTKKAGAVEVAVIEAKGRILGEVFSAGEDVEITWRTAAGHSHATEDPHSRFAFPASAKAVEKGDIVFLLEGASRSATIIRPCDGFWAIIRTSGPTTDRLPKWSHSITTFPTDLLLVWDWDETRSKSQYGEGYGHFISSRGVLNKCPRWGCRCQGHLDNAARLWKFGTLLNSLGLYEKAVGCLIKAMKAYRTGAELRIQDSPGHGPWEEADKRVLGMMDDLLIDDKGAVEAKDRSNLAPLSRTAEKGHEHEAVIQLLLAAEKAGIGERGAVAQLLLTTGKADVNAKNNEGQTPLLWAADNGHAAIVQLLLTIGKADVEAENGWRETPLLRAAVNGHTTVVQLLLATGKADVNARDGWGQTPLLRAAENGHAAVVQLLLATGKADVNAKNIWNRTPLSYAAANGHAAAVQLILATGKADVNAKDDAWDQTPLLMAAAKGHAAVVQLLLVSGKADNNAKDVVGRTPLKWATLNGHPAVVELLSANKGASVDAENSNG